jgi:hypothetical protein
MDLSLHLPARSEFLINITLQEQKQKTRKEKYKVFTVLKLLYYSFKIDEEKLQKASLYG